MHTQSYTYNNKGLLTNVTNTKGYNAVYDYDTNNRLIKSVVSGVTKEYSYQKKGEELLITEKDLSKSPITQSILIYKNGHCIGKDDYRFNNDHDKFNNLIAPFQGETLFYSEVENKTNEISLVYEKPSYGSINFLYDCKFYINNKRVGILFTKVINQKDNASVLLTGGGTYNDFLVERIKALTNAKIVIPSAELIEFKEALIFGFLGVLKLREENNCLASVTGASKDHSSGKIYKF